MGTCIRVNAARQVPYFFCLMLTIGWGSAANGDTSRPEPKTLKEEEDPSFQHPKAPPRPRQEDVPLTSTLFNLKLEGGYWGLLIDKDMPNADVSVVE